MGTPERTIASVCPRASYDRVRAGVFLLLSGAALSLQGQQIYMAGGDGGARSEVVSGEGRPAWLQAMDTEAHLLEGLVLKLPELEVGVSYELRIEWGARNEVWHTVPIAIAAHVDGASTWHFSAENTARLWVDRLQFIAQHPMHRIRITAEEGEELDLFVQQLELKVRKD
ncbi:MAG TPA: hypothetical protein VGE21_02350 [Flavobacteriales bacterium]